MIAQRLQRSHERPVSIPTRASVYPFAPAENVGLEQPVFRTRQRDDKSVRLARYPGLDDDVFGVMRRRNSPDTMDCFKNAAIASG